MNIHILLYNLIIILDGMLPAYGLILSLIKLNGKKWFILSETLIISGAIFYFIFTVQLDPTTAPVILYPLFGAFMSIFMALMVKKFGLSKFNRILGLTLMLGFISTVFWEIPITFYAIFNLFGKKMLLWNVQIFLLASFILALSLANVRLNKKVIASLTVSLIVSGLIIAEFPSMESYSGNIWVINRLICFLALGYVFLIHSKINEPHYIWKD